jgi:ABC-type transport system involved in multi-copper enzyme maturation permease subunit
MLENRTPLKTCVVGGSLLNVLVTFDFSQLFSSALLAVVGTLVSYFVSKGLKALFEKDPSN